MSSNQFTGKGPSTSSYFPQSAEELESLEKSSFSSRPQNSQLPPTLSEIQYPTYNRNDGIIHFPSSSSVLWDRSALAPPVFVNSADVLPSLILEGREVRKLLSILDRNYEFPAESPSDTFNANTYIYHAQTLPNNHQSLLRVLSRGHTRPDYMLSFERHGQNDLQLTVPITRVEAHCNSIIDLKANLLKTIVSSKDFCIKNFMRIRANGSVNTVGDAHASLRSGKIRFEAILPDISLQVLPIHPLSVLNTSLTVVIREATDSLAMSRLSPLKKMQFNAPSFCASNMGYVTLNQVRKAVFLADSDASLASTPLVGVWARLPSDLFSHGPSQDVDWTKLVQHPYIWAAAVRFLHHQRIGERVFVAPDTFLMALIVGNQAYFCEATAIFGNPVDTLATDNFLHMDFTATLSAETDIEGSEDNGAGGLICRFKPTFDSVRRRQQHRQNPTRESFSQLENSGYSEHFTSRARSNRASTEAASSAQNFDHQQTTGDQDDDEEDDDEQSASPRRYNLSALSPSSPAQRYTEAQSSRREFQSQPSIVMSSLESAPGAYSALQTAYKTEMLHQQSQQQRIDGSLEHEAYETKMPVLYHRNGNLQEHLDASLGPSKEYVRYRSQKSSQNLHESSNGSQPPQDLQYSFPAEVIVAQQRQIEGLQREVGELKEMVKQLTNALLQQHHQQSMQHSSSFKPPLTSSSNSITRQEPPAPASTEEAAARSSSEPLDLLTSSLPKPLSSFLPTKVDNVPADDVSLLFNNFHRQVLDVVRSSRTTEEESGSLQLQQSVQQSANQSAKQKKGFQTLVSSVSADNDACRVAEEEDSLMAHYAQTSVPTTAFDKEGDEEGEDYNENDADNGMAESHSLLHFEDDSLASQSFQSSGRHRLHQQQQKSKGHQYVSELPAAEAEWQAGDDEVEGGAEDEDEAAVAKILQTHALQESKIPQQQLRVSFEQQRPTSFGANRIERAMPTMEEDRVDDKDREKERDEFKWNTSPQRRNNSTRASGGSTISGSQRSRISGGLRYEDEKSFRETESILSIEARYR